MEHKISVILPVYKSEKYIFACLESVISQTYQPYEIIVVSDGCLDNSISIAREFLAATPIKYEIIEQPNQGVASARNNGIKRATGDWIIAIDSDDCIYPQTFEHLMNNASGHDVLTFAFGLNQPGDIAPIVNSCDIISLTGEEALAKFYNREYKFVSPAMMLSRDFISKNNLKYDIGCLFAEDDIYVWKILCRANQVLYINKPLYNYIFHAGSTMTTSNMNKFYSVKKYSENLDEMFIQESDNVGNYKDKILFRHYLGVIHAAAKVQKYREYKSLIKHYGMKGLYCDRFVSYTFKEKLMFAFPLICPFISYLIFRVK